MISHGDNYTQYQEGSGHLPGSPIDILRAALGLIMGSDFLGLLTRDYRARIEINRALATKVVRALNIVG